MKILGKTATALVACGTGLGLAAGLGTLPTASAAAVRHNSLIESVFRTNPGGSCVIEKGPTGNRDQHYGVGAGASYTGDVSRYIRTASGANVGISRIKGSSKVSPTTRNGSLTRLDVSGSGEASLFGDGNCGDSSGRMASGNAGFSFKSTQPVTAASWVRISASAAGAGGWMSTLAYDAQGRAIGQERDSPVIPKGTARLYVPRNGSAQISGVMRQTASLYRGSGNVSKSWNFHLTGVVTPVGTAVTVQRGKVKARRAVTLPSRVNCNTGKARVVVKRFGVKRAKAVRVVVNGKVVKALWEPKKRGYAVRVPKSGDFRITARVTLNNGKKPTTARRYIACR